MSFWSRAGLFSNHIAQTGSCAQCFYGLFCVLCGFKAHSFFGFCMACLAKKGIPCMKGLAAYVKQRYYIIKLS